MVNVLTDIKWIKTTRGNKTVRETILGAHTGEFNLDKNIEGYFYTTQLRILENVTAIAIRYAKRDGVKRRKMSKEGISPYHLDLAIEDLADGTDLHGGKYPFMQWPIEGDIKINKKVDDLLPIPTSIGIYDFWNLRNPHTTEELPAEEAVLWIASHALYSSAGNAKIRGNKMMVYTPGYRSSFSKNTPTEVIYEGKTLLDTIFNCVSKEHITGGGLPAWADRIGKCNTPTEIKPIWRDTWTSNLSVLQWGKSGLKNVLIGGVPDEWNHYLNLDEKVKKEKENLRRVRDLFYPYVTKKSDTETPTRELLKLNVGYNPTELAVAWGMHAYKNVDHHSNRYGDSDNPDNRPVIIQHDTLSGNPGSQFINYSKVTSTDPSLWIIPAESRQFVMKQLYSVGDYITNSIKGLSTVIAQTENGSIKTLESDIIDLFWANITRTYKEIITETKEGKPFDDNMKQEIRECLMNAFNEILRVCALIYPQEVYLLQGKLYRKLTHIT